MKQTPRQLIKALIEDTSLDLDAPMEAEQVGDEIVFYAQTKRGRPSARRPVRLANKSPKKR